MNETGIINVGEYSPIGIFISADYIVQSVIVLLLAASVASWTIMIARTISIIREARRTRHATAALTFVKTVENLEEFCVDSFGAIKRVLEGIGLEWRWSLDSHAREYDTVRQRILSTADLIVVREAKRLTGQTSMLATIGSTAPFVGLFGTVWGIMHSFISIGQSQDTSLAVVAPGIAEALMATAIGLFCAIPAVIGYNRLMQSVGQLEIEWRSAASSIEVAVSRQFQSNLRRF